MIKFYIIIVPFIEPETPYVAPQTVIDYGHGRSTEEKESKLLLFWRNYIYNLYGKVGM